MARLDEEQRGPEASAESEVKVTDRRLFTSDGQLRQELPAEEEQEKEEPPARSASAPDRARGAAAEPEQPGFQHRPVEEPAGVDFIMLLNAMAQPALLFLGEIPHPGTGQPRIDLEQARIQIDMLQVLRVKCRGNLTADEEALLDRILYQLRMLYVSRSGEPLP